MIRRARACPPSAPSNPTLLFLGLLIGGALSYTQPVTWPPVAIRRFDMRIDNRPVRRPEPEPST